MTEVSGEYPGQQAPLIQGRLYAIDVLKAISIAAVVSYHAVLLPVWSYPALLDANIFAGLRFCVPVLFTISFFLLTQSLQKNTDNRWKTLKKRFTRLLTPILFWFVLCSVLLIIKGNSLGAILHDILTGHVFIGSYYFNILLELIPLFILFNGIWHRTSWVIGAIVAQCLGYSLIHSVLFPSQSGIFKDIFNLLRIIDRPFIGYWFVYMFAGAFIYYNWSSFVQRSQHISVSIKTLMIVGVMLTSTLEQTHLRRIVPPPSIVPFGYTMYSCIASVFVFFLCFASCTESSFQPWMNRVIQILSRYSLGIFCIHGILSLIFAMGVRSVWPETWTITFLQLLPIKLLGWLVLLGISLVGSKVMERFGLGKMVR